MLIKIWSSIEVTIHSEDDKFKVTAADNIAKLKPSVDKSHEHTTATEHLQSAFNHVLDAFNHLSYGNYDDKSIKLNPIGKHFVKVCYHGSKPAAVFTMTVQYIGRVLSITIKYCSYMVRTCISYIE